MGYVEPEALLGSVSVLGRGGTVLQPGLDKLTGAEDFPKDAPILIITDGGCDVLTVPGFPFRGNLKPPCRLKVASNLLHSFWRFQKNIFAADANRQDCRLWLARDVSGVCSS
jgi:hypothetical protein